MFWKVKVDDKGRFFWSEMKPISKSFVDSMSPKEKADDFAKSKNVDKIRDERSLTSTEKEMLANVNDYLGELREWHYKAYVKMKNDFSEKFSEIVPLQERFDKIKEDLIFELEELKAEFEEKYKIAFQDEKSARRDLASFRVKNKISRQAASVPEVNRFLDHGLLLVFICLESVLNAAFFDSDYGYIGGGFYAFVFSVINIYFGFFAGYIALRLTFHVKKHLSFLGFLLLFVYFSFFISLQFFIARFRDYSVEFPDLEIIDVIQSMINNPFSVKTMDSMLLLCLGLLLGLIAFYKGFKSDDPYPGFGEAYRKWKSLNAISSKINIDAKKDLALRLKKAKENIFAIPASLRAQESVVDDCIRDSGNYFHCLGIYLANVLDVSKMAVLEFREHVQKVLENPCRYKFIDSEIESAIDIFAFGENKNEILHICNEEKRNLCELMSEYEKNKEKLIEEIDKIATNFNKNLDNLRGEIHSENFLFNEEGCPV
ncbi:hypothetical protein [Marichromatium sp. AB31]|uniref:hypothetical protein n=1 Tax=Marichromatium sp. AB31 TaxID=2483362 RepID=UPI0011CDAB56|nr:hypothetical protein [Marichromatium sp. AB31]